MKKESFLKVIGVVVVTALVLFAGVPLILEYLIFRNNVYSVLTNGEWGSFLGSYIGGIVGGAGTLVAMWVTTKETRRIQKENLNQLRENRSLEDKKERKQFTDGIAETVSAYIADILKYLENADKFVSLQQKRENLHDTLLTIRESIDKYNQTIRNGPTVPMINAEEKRRAEKDLQQALWEESRVQQDIATVDKEISDLERSRLVADQCYYLLKIKLDSRNLCVQPLAQNLCVLPLMKKLDEIQSWSIPGGFFEFSVSKEDADELLQLTSQFISAYMKDDDSFILDMDNFMDDI